MGLRTYTDDLDDCIVGLSSVSTVHSVGEHGLILGDFDLSYDDSSTVCLECAGVQDHLPFAPSVCPDVRL